MRGWEEGEEGWEEGGGRKKGGEKRKILRARNARRSRREEGDEGRDGGGKVREEGEAYPLVHPLIDDVTFQFSSSHHFLPQLKKTMEHNHRTHYMYLDSSQ